ncbi:sensor protein KdpD [Butyricimonas hominis]|uniref:Sensor protein KdpD n=1 Tax=Butyricimonas hominis TaxID=2763032 RepID=A0ABR7CWW9_9BACT|nr:sensor protein KdpD [Butyricimonas hominis]MBC5620181.1 sensor protein KdpD [Butyricimonas hominis]
MGKEENVQYFLDLIKRSRRGKFKIYIGMIAGVGKTYRMLQEAHELLENGIDVQIGYIETHGRTGTEALAQGLPVIPRKKIFYKAKEMEEMDLEGILLQHPELVIVDELAHTNVEGSQNEKRWQDVIELLNAGISVISAVNIQHIESLNEEVKNIAGIEVKERIPDSVLQEADEVVNIDLTAEELINRLKAGKIYRPEKIQLALNNFFKTENILQLRELALKEVAFRVEKKVETEVVAGDMGIRHEKFLACVSSNEKTPRHIIRKAARLAAHYNTTFIALYVQTPRENADRIGLATQRHLLNHFKLATELGGEVMQIASPHVWKTIVNTCRTRQITTICMGQPSFRMPASWIKINRYRKFLNAMREMNIDLIILA